MKKLVFPLTLVEATGCTSSYPHAAGDGDTGHAEILGAKSLNGLLLFTR